MNLSEYETFELNQALSDMMRERRQLRRLKAYWNAKDREDDKQLTKDIAIVRAELKNRRLAAQTRLPGF